MSDPTQPTVDVDGDSNEVHVTPPGQEPNTESIPDDEPAEAAPEGDGGDSEPEQEQAVPGE